jgi:hypothetical protein
VPTILTIGGWRFVIYLNDHSPAHVHVMGPGWSVVIDVLGSVKVREVVGRCTEREARQVLALAEIHQQTLQDAWKRIHG